MKEILFDSVKILCMVGYSIVYWVIMTKIKSVEGLSKYYKVILDIGFCGISLLDLCTNTNIFLIGIIIILVIIIMGIFKCFDTYLREKEIKHLTAYTVMIIITVKLIEISLVIVNEVIKFFINLF